MQLKVTVRSGGEDGLAIEQNVTSFDDAEKIGVQVGRAVRDFLRHVPLTRSGARTAIDVRAAYVERAERESNGAAPKRRKKAKAPADAST